MKINDLLDKTVTLTQVRSGSKFTKKQKGNLLGLGLRGIGSSVELKCNQPILGMIRKISHVIKITTS